MTPEEFEKKLEELELKKADFAALSNMKKGTVHNWGTSRILNGEKQTIVIPPWVEPFLEYYEKGKKFEQLRELLQ